RIDIGIVGRDVAAVVQRIPAAAGQQHRAGEAEHHLAARIRCAGDGGLLRRRRRYLLMLAAERFDRIAFGHFHLLLKSVQAAANPPPRARTSCTSRVKARVSSWATARRALTTLSCAVSTSR